MKKVSVYKGKARAYSRVIDWHWGGVALRGITRFSSIWHNRS